MTKLKKQSKSYPYQNTSLEDLPGEEWKEIPDFEGYYEISNYGRVKSLYRQLVLSDGRPFRVAERIKRSKLNIYRNKTLNEPVYLLSVGLHKEGKGYYFSIGRLVYWLFVEDFNIDDERIWISYRDGDAKNVHVSNLIKTDVASTGLMSNLLGRRKNNFTEAKKAVTQFDSKGKVLKHYESLNDAAIQTGFKAPFISKAAHGVWNIYQSCFWRFGKHTKNLDFDKLLKGDEDEGINEGLMKAVGLKKIKGKQVPAFLNLSVQSMKGEKWKNIPGLEGLYQVSNLGRIKSVGRFIFSSQQQLKPEKIVRPYLYLIYDNRRRQIPGGLLVSVRNKNINHTFALSRLVYGLFVKKMDVTDRSIKIDYKDKNPMNVHYKNLVLKENLKTKAKAKR